MSLAKSQVPFDQPRSLQYYKAQPHPFNHVMQRLKDLKHAGDITIRIIMLTGLLQTIIPDLMP